MGTNYSRPLGLACNQGLPNRVCKNPNSEKFTESTSPVSGQEINSRQGSIRITGEACNSLGESTSSRGGFCKFPVCSPQKRGRQPPGSQPETPKPVFGLRAFQDGGDPHVERPLKTRGLVGKNRSKRCILNSTHLENPPEVPSFSVEREHAGVCLPPLWPSNSTQGLHQTHETSNSFTASKRALSNYLFRRCTFDGRIASSSPLSSSINSEFARKPRFHCQLQEIPFRPSTTIRVFRGPSGHQRPFPLLARRKTKKDSEEVAKHSRSIGNISKGIIKIPGPLDLFHSSDLPCPPAFQTPTESKKQDYGLLPVLRGSNTTRSSLQRGDSVVEGPPSSMEWQGPFPEASRAHHRDRCISKGVGGILSRDKYRGSLVLRRKKVTHQLP